jgi:hypothetical protein
MVFLAQVNCAELPALADEWRDPAPWPDRGALVRVFANRLRFRGAPCAARALATNPSAELVRTAAPVIAVPLPDGSPYEDEEVIESDGRLPECVVRPVPFLSAPEALPGIAETWWDSSELAERYQRFAHRVRYHGTNPTPARPRAVIHHFLGEPTSIQDDVKWVASTLVEDLEAARDWEITPDPELGTPRAWRCLLALHDDDRIGLVIADAGALHVMVPVADLSANRLTRLMCDEGSC